MKRFLAWADGWNDEVTAKTVHALDAEGAAEAFVERHFVSLDYPSCQDVDVRDSDGVLSRWTVEVSERPVFAASRREPAKPR